MTTTPATEDDLHAAKNGEEPAIQDRDWPVVARVEVDRFCETCGYNLYTRPVLRHPTLDLMLVRCPDCGRFHAARDTASAISIWARRLAVPLVILWIAAVLSMMFFTVLGTIAMTMVTVDEGTRYTKEAFVLPDGSEDERWVRVRDQRFPDDLEEVWMLRAMRAGLVGIGFTITAFAALAFPHWRRWGYGIWVFVLAVIPPLIIIPALRYERFSQDAVTWAQTLTFTHTLWFAGGATVAIFVARPMARGLLRLFLTPMLLQPLAWLWSADGKPPPSVNRPVGTQSS